MPTLHDPVAFTVFGLSIRWYALFILSGIIAAIVLIRALARRRGMDPEFILDIAPLTIAGSIIGARVAYVLVAWQRFRGHWLDAINIREGGIAIHGAVIAGGLIVAWYCRRSGQRYLRWGDLILPGVALGQAFGRWGNWANQEAFGTPTSVPWAVHIDPDHRPARYAAAATFQPTFLYESITDLITAAILTAVALRMPGSRWLREGDGVWLYLVLYGVSRMAIESIRTDSIYVGPLPGPTWVSLLFIAGGVAGAVLSRTKWPTPRIVERPLVDDGEARSA